MNRLRRVLTLLAVAGTLAVWLSSPASAACHQFTFDKDAYSVPEGAGSITITVSRDNGFAPSSISYETVDATAKAGQDYTARSGTLSYGTEISMSFSVPVTGDSKDEPNETFQVRLHDPSGCAPNPTYDVDDPSTVTIQDDDAPPPPKPSTNPTSTMTSPSPSPTATRATPSGAPATTTTAGSPSVEPSTTGPTVGARPAGDQDENAGGGIATIVAALLVVGVGGALLARRRTRAS